jgi:membrane-anchored mycosin MYCP
MQRSATGSRKLRPLRAAAVAATTLIVASVALSGSPAYAINPPGIDPAAVPPDSPPGPSAPMKQSSYCTEVGVLPGTDFRVQPKYMDMLNLSEAWRFGRGAGVRIAVIDTGVTPHPRLPHLVPGGDYVMGGGDGLSDCDAHGTLVASMIGGAPAPSAGPGAPGPRRAPPVPTREPPPPAPPPQTISVAPPPPQTITLVPPPPPSQQDQGPPPPFGAPPPPFGAPPPPGGAPPPAFGPPPGPQQPKQPGAANRGHGKMVLPGYSRGGQIVSVDYPRPAAPPPLDPPPTGPADAFTGIAPDAELVSIRQSSQAFTLKDAYTGDEDPQTRQKSDNIRTMARAIVHAANMGARVINISQVMCMSARSLIDQPDLGAAVRYAAVDKDAVIVAAAGDTSQRDCKENPLSDPLHPSDSRDWNGVTTVVTPSWFSDYVLTVGAVDSSGTPMDKLSVAGPWVSIAAPGTDVVGLSPRDDSLINAIDGPDNSLLVPAGTSFSTAIVSGVAALVRAKYPQLSAHQIVNRLIRTARAPGRGVDNQIGYGVIDPVAALTWDVPDGSVLPKESGSPLKVPPAPTPRNMTPVWVAAGGLGGALLIAGLVFGAALLMRKTGRQE